MQSLTARVCKPITSDRFYSLSSPTGVVVLDFSVSVYPPPPSCQTVMVKWTWWWLVYRRSRTHVAKER